MKMIDDIKKLIQTSAENIQKSISLSSQIQQSIESIIQCIKNGNKIILFGNGGSAADAQHIAAELIGRFKLERKSFPAIALTTDTSILTSLGNDYSYDVVFSRQCESLVSKGDVVIGISTSGNSKNVIEGIKAAKQKGAITIGLLGNEGGILKEVSDIPIIVNSSITSEIQEVHRVIYHIICKIVETELAKK
jgi:D-sedoheptulose 7-phosphate isomerase|tara:strand:+ start:462 stop:1037 length:576 start_codon:yes stop_codon:yes gene_type:complete